MKRKYAFLRNTFLWILVSIPCLAWEGKAPAEPRSIVAVRPEAPPPKVAIPPDAVSIQFSIYQVRGDISGNTSLTDNITEGVGNLQKFVAQNGPFTFFTLADLKVADGHLRAGTGEWNWDKKEGLPTQGFISLANPRVLVIPGQTFEIQIGSDVPEIQYFEKRDDGLFELKKIKVRTGLSVSGKVEKGVSESIVLKDLTFNFTTLEKRNPIEGVTLEVGKPEIKERSLKTTVSLKPNYNYGIEMPTEGEGVLFIRLRIEYPYQPDKKE